MENLVNIIYISFVAIFVIVPGAVVLADQCSDRFHGWLRRRIRKARRDLASWLLAPEGLTVRPLTETETALAPVTVDVDDELVELLRRWSA